MSLDSAFVDDCPYSPEALLIDEVLSVDVSGSRVVARMPIHAELPLTRHQRVHPVKHPRHLSGGLMVHMTGMLGFVHAYYVFGLRHAEGWIGYGAKIHAARFTSLAVPPEPLVLTGWTTRTRRGGNSIVARYNFEFRQDGKLVYEGDQTAMWLKTDAAHPLLSAASSESVTS
jgi:3-hydroxymyristoyl/3-hydroxydecanoyl-(acyl carrier protein) dehydratase